MTIQIKIAGHTAEGKSAIAELVRKTLADIGIEVTLNDDNSIGIVDERPGVIADSLDSRLKSIKGRGTKVEIQTVCTRRPPTVAKPIGGAKIDAEIYKVVDAALANIDRDIATSGMEMKFALRDSPVSMTAETYEGEKARFREVLAAGLRYDFFLKL